MQSNSPSSTSSISANHQQQQQPTAIAINDDSSLKGALGRAAAVLGPNITRVLGVLYRVPLKAFRQNKFDLAEGHAAIHEVAPSTKPLPKPKPLKVLMEHQGRTSVAVKQVLPSLVANIAVGTVMFKTFDHSMARLSQARQDGRIPTWMCSTTLSTGAIPSLSSSSSSSASAHPSTAFLRPFTGPDVFVSGFLAGAAQTPLVTPMENSATWMRMKYVMLQEYSRMQQQMTSEAVAAAASTSSTVATATVAAPTTASSGSTAAAKPSLPVAASSSLPRPSPLTVNATVLEATATNLMPPPPPNDMIRSLNVYSSLREITTHSRFAIGGATTSATTASSASATVDRFSAAPPVGLFSHLTFRLARDSLGLGLFFFSFEFIHGRMKTVPYQWMEIQEENDKLSTLLPSTPSSSTFSSLLPTSSTSSSASPSHGPSFSVAAPLSPYLMSSLIGWEVISVVMAGAIAGTTYHIASYPFFHVLELIENQQIRAWQNASSTSSSSDGATKKPRGGAWSQLRSSFNSGGFSFLSQSMTKAKRPKLFNPLVFGLIVYTLSKTEHHTHQFQAWREERQKRKREIKSAVI